jgi:hypothetical protein
MRSRISTYGLVVALFIVWGAAAFAQENALPPSGHGHAIAAVRIAACAGMSNGAPCSFSHHGQQVKGICHASRQGQLACRSRHHGHRGEDMPGLGGGMPEGSTP